MNRQIIVIAGWLTLLSSATIADDLTIPNTFTPGTPARAAEVNGNFTAVETSVDDNAADISANITSIQANSNATQANASSIASLVSGTGLQVYSQGSAFARVLDISSTGAWLLSGTGYMFETELGDSNPKWLRQMTIYYAELNCVGTAYVTGWPEWVGINGGVFVSRDLANPQVVYVPQGSERQPFTSLSRNTGGGCLNGDATSLFHAAFPNDESITGVSNNEPLRPYKIGSP